MKKQALSAGKFAGTQPSVFELMPGDVAIGFAGDHLKTLLGSCVSVILTDPRRTVAAMCHIVHAGLPNAANRGNTAYASVAMDEMFMCLTAIGVIPTRCEAYVFGGGNMFPALFAKHHVGDSNVQWVLDYLHTQGIAIVDHCLAGAGYRKISWTIGPSEPVVETVFPEQGH
nr:chemotaxis protein CheD [uncultured Rhodoferax sp.]